MKAYRLVPGAGIAGLRQEQVPERPLGAFDVRVALHAAALNARDLAIARGQYGGLTGDAITPLSDGVGTVVAVGPSVTRVAVGDHVIATFWPDWIDGEGTRESQVRSFGAQLDGTLAEQLVAPETALVHAPARLSDAGAASIACAGVTAWNALFVQGGLRPGASVLILGTGSVATWALQLAKAAGLHAIVTSSSNGKLAEAERLGARGVVNYAEHAEWQDEVLRLTGGEGVDLVLEVGGQDTLARSLAAVRFGGRVVVIGGVSGWGDVKLSPGALVGGKKTLGGLMVGSRRMTEDLVRFIDTTGLTPVVDSVFPYAEATNAYERLASGSAFGKVVVSLK
ncbi:zinc-dependent alcohol dehydrogenase family protein [Roseateles chitinivorans]|uniref:zinc-dependent alcohol dehydrogenase family protein n=1 Tax=Roseateles chitinivorans TaxID=2917965 RepID=UPI003D66A6C7